MEVAGLPEIFVPTYQIIRRHVSEASNLQVRKCNILHSANLSLDTIKIKTFFITLITT
jgi:hypothetical protein